jgi:essential nuclear protein 1
LEKIREDISENRRLNYHYYYALKKALYRPSAFFKGILLPICEDGTCTLREATIIASVLTKVSIPVIHSAAALMKLAEMRYSGANSLFIRVLLNKKYSLPMRVVEVLCDHFAKFATEKRALPVLWHQALLVFTQRYKQDISPKQRNALKAVLRVHVHPLITADVRRELFVGNQGPHQGSADAMEM